MARVDAVGTVIAIERSLAPRSQDRVGVGPRIADDDLELGDEHLADAEVGRGVERALPRQPGRGTQQVAAGTPIRPRGAGDLVGELGHERRRCQEPLRIGPVAMALVEGDEPT